MEKDIKEIRSKVEQFMKKYNCMVKIETTSYGRYGDGTIVGGKVLIHIDS